MAFGRGHQQIGILVEPKAGHALDPTNTAAVAEFRNIIWSDQMTRNAFLSSLMTYGRPRVEEANRVVPAFSRVFKEMILLTDPNRPLPRAGKETVQHKKALEIYAQDIENL